MLFVYFLNESVLTLCTFQPLIQYGLDEVRCAYLQCGEPLVSTLRDVLSLLS